MAFTDTERRVLQAYAKGELPEGIAITTKVVKPEVARILKLVGNDRQQARVALNDEAAGARIRQLGVQAASAAPSGTAKSTEARLPESALVNPRKPGEPTTRPGTIDALLEMAEVHDSANVRGAAALVRAALQELDETLAADDARAAAQRRVDELTEELEQARQDLLAFQAPGRRVTA
jgi:hypothetical protein